jgi:hypothetical protein
MTTMRFSLDYGALRHITSLDNHYEAVPQPMPWQQAQQYCKMNDYDLASIHSAQEQQLASDTCSKLTQRTRASQSSECQHQLTGGDTNIASNQWISPNEEFVYVGCFVSDGGSANGGVTPWPDTGELWKTTLNWMQVPEAN